jgi:hypothetical protein
MRADHRFMRPADQPPVVPSPFAKVRRIWPDNFHWNLHNTYALFRKSFTLEAVPARAPLFFTAD